MLSSPMVLLPQPPRVQAVTVWLLPVSKPGSEGELTVAVVRRACWRVARAVAARRRVKVARVVCMMDFWGTGLKLGLFRVGSWNWAWKWGMKTSLCYL